jgi:PAS domain S-box-containing protein
MDDGTDFLLGGEMARHIAAYDWAETPLGPMSDWPSSVRTTVALILRSPVPMLTLWGEAGIMIYNDAYSVVAGQRHPQLLGSEVRKGWPEVTEFNDRVMQVVFGAGGALSFEDQEMILDRSGHPEQVFMDLDYSPVVGEDGVPVGVIAIIVETTERHWAQRRAEAIARLSERIQELDDPADVAYAAAEMIGTSLNVSRVGYGSIDRSYLTFDVSRDWAAPGVPHLTGLIEFEHYFEVLAELRKGEPVAVADAARDPRTADIAPVLDAARAVAFINVPVMEGGEVVALLFVNNATPRNWSDGEIRFVEDVANRARTAVERRRAEAELRQNEARLRFLDALNRETARSLDADQVMATTTRMTGEHLGVSICAYADVAPDGDHFTIRGDWTAPGSRSIVGHYRLTDFGEPGAEKVRAGQPLVINDNLKDLPPEPAAMFQSMGIGSTVRMPLVKQGRLSVMMAVHHKGPHEWTEVELATLSEVVERSWAHIERVRAEAEMAEGEQRFREMLESEIEERSLALEQSEAQFRLLVQGVTDYAIYMLDTSGNVSSWNAGAQRIKGYAPEEVIGTHFSRFYTPEDLETGLPARALATALAEGRFEKEGWRVRKDGTRFWAHVIIDALRAPDGRHLGFAKITRDITERREAQIALEHARDQLQQSQKMEAIGNLTGGIAHDFNNLLMAVLGSLELLRKRLPADPALLRLLDNAVQGANRGASLTRRMLAFARRQELRSERVDAASLVGGMTELLQRALGPMVAVETRFPNRLAPIEADANQLESALLNLAVNARDAMHGEGSITISGREQILAEEDDNLLAGRYVVLAVTDTGEGMDEATLQRATEPFFTTKGVGKGTGLGLSMVLGLAEQLGGTLKLISAPGKGTTAEIWLPAATGAVEAASAPARIEPEMSPSARRRLKVLAVDDDALVLMNTSAMLADMGHDVTEAYSGREALKAMEANGYDLVITDHAMPQMTGAQLSAAIRERWPSIPIILATGYAELPSDADPGLPRIGKPFSEADLARIVEAATRDRAPVD